MIRGIDRWGQLYIFLCRGDWLGSGISVKFFVVCLVGWNVRKSERWGWIVSSLNFMLAVGSRNSMVYWGILDDEDKLLTTSRWRLFRLKQDVYIYSHIPSWKMGHVLRSQFFAVELSKNRLFMGNKESESKATLSHYFLLTSWRRPVWPMQYAGSDLLKAYWRMGVVLKSQNCKSNWAKTDVEWRLTIGYLTIFLPARLPRRIWLMQDIHVDPHNLSSSMGRMLKSQEFQVDLTKNLLFTRMDKIGSNVTISHCFLPAFLPASCPAFQPH
jgi:hypothetical protein